MYLSYVLIEGAPQIDCGFNVGARSVGGYCFARKETLTEVSLSSPVLGNEVAPGKHTRMRMQFTLVLNY